MKEGLLGNGKVISFKHWIRPSDLDSLGHVNNARALEYFELGRYQWLDENQLRYSRNVVAVVRRAELLYKREIQMTEIVITTLLTEQSFFGVAFLQTIVLAENGLAAIEGRVNVSFIDSVTRRPRRVVDFLA